MSIFRTTLLLYFLLISHAIADTDSTSQEENSYIDGTHEYISEKVLDLSKGIDTTVNDWFKSEEDDSADTLEEVDSMDEFFINEKYIDDTDKAFIRLGLNSNFQSKTEEDYTYNLRARLPLSRTKKRLKLFVQTTFSDDDDREVNSIANNPNNKNAKTEVGLSLFAPQNYGIKSRYDAGIRSLDPFVRARYRVDFEAGEWDIDMSQFFKYSVDDKFSEGTRLYFDTKFEESKLFRILLHRDTSDSSAGMSYGIGFHYYIPKGQDAAVRLSQTFTGNTKYTYIDENAISHRHSEINNYTTSIGWRENVLKEWIYYEVTPAVNFHKQYDYDVNYSLNFSLEFYFGRHK